MKTRILLGAFGLLVMAYALYGASMDTGIERIHQPVFLATLIVAHDFFLLPLGIAVGAVAARLLPPRFRRTVQGGLWASAIVTLLSFPFIFGNGHPRDNPSALPRNYPLGLAIVLLAIWLVAAALLLVRHLLLARHLRGAQLPR